MCFRSRSKPRRMRRGPPTVEGREDWRKLALVTIDPADAKDHDDAVHACPDPDPANPGGHILTVAIADVAHYVRPGSALDREARQARQLGVFPGPRRADAAGAHLQRSVLAAPARGPRGARGADDHRQGRPQAIAHLPSRADEVGGQAQLPAGPGRDRRRARRGHRPPARYRAAPALRRLRRTEARPRRRAGRWTWICPSGRSC